MTKQTQPTKKTATKKQQEPTYTLDDVLSQSEAIGEKPEVLAGALLHLGKDELTKAEIDKALRDFKTKEVK